ncbi:unnamed protein product [Chironomus riparius]|uniref:Chitin-binding type-2 domain-containing protein n=1 Tax=Chironomus riparius TaxID=315576 RepID=A0A9N9WZ43_9DIPT|nr:unnamed protein product [Chironomus riparius]
MQNKQIILLITLISFLICFYLPGNICDDIPGDYCRGLNGVLLPHPDPTRCAEFVLCLFENPILRQCLRTNEIFYPPAQDCVFGNPETCEPLIPTPKTTTQIMTITETEVTTIITTLIHETTETDDIIPTTIAATDSTTISNATIEATTKNYSSSETTTEEPTATSTSTTSRLPTTAPIPVHRCPPSGFGNIPHHTNCSRYFECISGIRHLRFCPGGMLFDSVTLECTYPELAVCAG